MLLSCDCRILGVMINCFTLRVWSLVISWQLIFSPLKVGGTLTTYAWPQRASKINPKRAVDLLSTWGKTNWCFKLWGVWEAMSKNHMVEGRGRCFLGVSVKSSEKQNDESHDNFLYSFLLSLLPPALIFNECQGFQLCSVITSEGSLIQRQL